MAKPPPPLPMPVELVTDHTALRTMGDVAYSATLCLCVAYWQGGCKPLSDVPADLMAVGRISAPGWVRSGSLIRQALLEVLPILHHARENRLQLAEVQKARAARLHAKRRAEGVGIPHQAAMRAARHRKPQAATVEQVVAQAALEQAGLPPRRLAPSEIAAGVVATTRHTVAPLTRDAAVPLDGMATHAKRGLVDTATRR